MQSRPMECSRFLSIFVLSLRSFSLTIAKCVLVPPFKWWKRRKGTARNLQIIEISKRERYFYMKLEMFISISKAEQHACE